MKTKHWIELIRKTIVKMNVQTQIPEDYLISSTLGKLPVTSKSESDFDRLAHDPEFLIMLESLINQELIDIISDKNFQNLPRDWGEEMSENNSTHKKSSKPRMRDEFEDTDRMNAEPWWDDDD